MKSSKLLVFIGVLAIGSAVIASSGQKLPKSPIITEAKLNGDDVTIPLEPILSRPFPYLIIYADAFEWATNQPDGILYQFAEWKRKKGFDVTMINQDDIVTNPSVPDYQEIRDYIRDEWWEPIWSMNSYVLLVGDAPCFDPDYLGTQPERYTPVQIADEYHIPTYAGYNHHDKGGKNFSDYYYQLMDTDYDPDLAIGRWSIDPGDPATLSTYVNKTFAYERDVSSNWDPCEAVLVASYGGYEDPRLHERTKDQTALFFPTSYRDEDDDIQNMKIYRYSLSKQVWDLMLAVDDVDGTGIVNYSGHGDWGTWQSWDGLTPHGYDCFDTSFVENYFTPGYPLVFNCCCWNGCITATDTVNINYEPITAMVEAWTRNPNGGAAAAFGASRVSNIPSCDIIDEEIFRGLFDPAYGYLDCGKAINRAKKIVIQGDIGHVPDLADTSTANMFYWIGDPELDVWRGIPYEAEISTDLLCVGTPPVLYLRVTVTAIVDYVQKPVSGAKVCIYTPGISEFHYVSHTDSDGKTIFPCPTSPAYITATNQKGTLSLNNPDPEASPSIRPKTVLVDYYHPSQPQPYNEVKESTQPAVWNHEASPQSIVGSSARISYSIGGSGLAFVNLAIFDASGREVRSLVSGEQTSGQHQVTWDGLDDAGASCPAGVYFVSLRSQEFNATQRIVVLK
jgi:hypothetical protein